jgi:hypothetical protein
MSPPADSHPIRTAVVSTVIATVAVAVLAELWPPVKTAIAWCWSQVKSFYGLLTAEHPAPGWLLALLSLLALATLVRWTLVLLRRKEDGPPEFQSYRTDHLYGAKWRWSWQGREVTNLWCFCPSCDSELVYDDSSCRDVLRREEPRTDFFCEHCGHTQVASIKGGNRGYALSAITREIRRKLRTGQAPTGARSEA